MAQLSRDIIEIARCGTQYRADHFAPMGLKSCHGSYLWEVCRDPGISQDKLAKRICFNKSNIARQAAALEEGGFLIRRPCEDDKRVMRLYPTEKTLELLPQIQQILCSWSGYLTQDLTEEEKELLGTLLAKMKARAADYMEEG